MENEKEILAKIQAELDNFGINYAAASINISNVIMFVAMDHHLELKKEGIEMIDAFISTQEKIKSFIESFSKIASRICNEY